MDGRQYVQRPIGEMELSELQLQCHFFVEFLEMQISIRAGRCAFMDGPI